MNLEIIRALYGYNHWATEIVLDAAEKLTPEQWLTDGGAGRGSIRDTLVHLIGGQKRWLAWWDGSLSVEESVRLQLNLADFPDLPAVRAAWATVDQATQAFVSQLTEADLPRIYSRTMPDGGIVRFPLWQMLLQVANHGTQHRSEIAAMLTSHGHSPGELDILRYFLYA